MHAWLGTYEREGDTKAQEVFLGAPSLVPLATQLMAHGEAWVKASAPDTRNRRTLLAAIAALDLMNAGLASEWNALTPLMEWGCSRVRELPKGTETERLWHLSAIALLGGGKRMDFLGTGRKGHLTDHVLPRVPDEPRFRLAAVAMTQGQAPPRHLPPRDFKPPVHVGWFAVSPKEVHPLYRRLYSDPVVGEEARVRHVDYLLDLREAAALAVALDDALPVVRDPTLRYSLLFVAGQFHELNGRDEDALPYYQEAHGLFPSGVTAALALSATLHSAGRSTEAEALLTPALRSAERDPWHLFQLHDYRFYSQWRRALWESVR